MKITIAVHHFPPRYVSGAEKETFRVARGLLQRGHAVQVVCIENVDQGPADGVAYEDTLYEGIPVRRLSFRQTLAPDPWLWSYDNPWIGEHIAAWLAEQKPDLFFLVSGYKMTASVLRAAYQLNIPTAVYLTDFWFLCPRITLLRSNHSLSTPPVAASDCARCLGEEKRRYQWLGKLAPGIMETFWRKNNPALERIETRRDLLRKMLAQADVMISPSHFLYSMYEKAGFMARSSVFIRQGLDRKPEHVPAARSLPGTGLRIGYIGQIAAHKGVHVLVDAVHSLQSRQVSLEIYGDMTAFPAYMRQLQETAAGDERIHFKGVFQGLDQLEEIMNGFDVVVVPSVWYENSPNAILEALSYKVPVITSNLGGMAELVQHEENGLLFRSADAADLAVQLERLLTHPELLARMRSRIQPVKSIEQQIDEIERLFAQVAKR